MSKTRKQGLSLYVERVMQEKRLSRQDVKLRSGGEISATYVSGIISGRAKNLSVAKLKALARGLRVREIEVMRVAFGLSDEPLPDRAADHSHNLLLLDITKKTVIGNDIAEIVREVIRLSPAQRAVVLQYVKRVARADRRARRKSQRKRRSG